MSNYTNVKPLQSYSGRVKNVDGDKVTASLRDQNGLERDVDLALQDIETRKPLQIGSLVCVDVFRQLGNGRAIKEKIYII